MGGLLADCSKHMTTELGACADPQNKKPSHEDWAFCLNLCGAGKRNRTPDLRITNALLYRLSYSGINIRETRL